jgi:hypothetical protein
MKNFLALILILPLIAIISCKDDEATTQPVTKTNYLNVKIGSKWTGEEYILDTAKSERLVGSKANYTLEIKTKETFDGKSAALFVREYGVSNRKDSNYYALENDGSVVYEYGREMQSTFNSALTGLGVTPINLGIKWVKVADASSTSWVALNQNLKDVPVSVGSLSGSLNGTLVINATKTGTNQVSIDGKTLTAELFTHTLEIKTIASVLGSPLGNINFSTTIKYWFVPGYGLIRYLVEPSTLTATVPGFPSTTKLNGLERIALTYTEAK